MKWYKRISYFLLSIFVLAGILVAVLQSRWGQETIRTLITTSLEKGGVQVKIGSIEGQLPQKLTFKRIEIDLPEGSTLSIETLTAQISLFYFLKNEISFKELTASEIVWNSGEKKDSSLLSSTPSLPSLPMSFSVKSFSASDVIVDQVGPLSLQGRIEIGSKRHHLFLDLKANRAEDKVRLMILAKKNGTSQWSADVDIVDSTLLDPFYKAPYHGAIQMKIYSKIDGAKEMQGRLEGKALLKDVPEPFQIPWTFKARFKHKTGSDWSFSQGVLNSDLLKARASASVDAKGNLIEAAGQLQSDKLLPKPFNGRLFSRWMVRKEEDRLIGKAIAQVPSLHAGPFEWKNVEMIAGGSNGEGTFALHGESWKANGDFTWNETLKLTGLQIDSPEIRGFGDLEFLSGGELSGTNEWTLENLQILKPLAPELDPYGQLHVKTVWNGKNVKLDMTAKGLYLKSFYFEQAALYSDLNDPFGRLSGIVSIDATQGTYRDLHLESAEFETKIGGESWPFKLFADGVWSRDFETHLDGIWHWDPHHLTGSIQNWSGLFYNHPFVLKDPVHFESSPSKTEISNTQIDLAAASLIGRYRKEGDSGDLYLRLEQFPLDFLSINPLEMSITGQLDFEGKVTEVHKRLQGDFKAALKYVEISELGSANPINAEGMASGRLDQDTLTLQGSLFARDEPLASIDLRLPIRLQLQPWRTEILYTKPSSGHFSLNGRIEDFLDFFNLGPHWLEGDCACDLRWSNTLRHPLIEGYFRIEDGYYENYYTGTQLTDLQADLFAEKDTLYLRTLKAKDGVRKGALLGDGSIQLRIDEKLPFRLHLGFQRFNFVQLGFISAQADGAIEMKGNLESALAQGHIRILDSDISIPEKLTRNLPNLQVVYLNAQKPQKSTQHLQTKPYPLNLDLKIDAPNGVIISGRGLQSEWKGNFVLEGTYSAPQPKGKLELIKGEFGFSGRHFKLTQGALTFTGHEHEMPYLDLSGSTEQQGISIIVNLRGPLNSPQLTFHSVPPLPLSAIIAHLLFGQDISEINGLQALQLATSVAKIAGEGPDVLETTRRSLGIDRLRIVSAPNDEGGESVAIQVGKYVAKGVIVSITQSAENSAPNISIEVDIGSGFYFQAESDQIHEQGKFAVKWNRNY